MGNPCNILGIIVYMQLVQICTLPVDQERSLNQGDYKLEQRELLISKLAQSSVYYLCDSEAMESSFSPKISRELIIAKSAASNRYLKNKLPTDEQEKFHFFNSFFFRKLADLDKNPSSACNGREAFQRVRKWTRKVNLFEKDYILIPINFR